MTMGVYEFYIAHYYVLTIYFVVSVVFTKLLIFDFLLAPLFLCRTFFLTALSIKLKALLRLVFTKFLLSSLGFFLYSAQLSKVFFVKVLTVDLYDLLINRFLSAICILFFAELLLATEDLGLEDTYHNKYIAV